MGSILTQVSHTAVQNNMRQALMALSDHIVDPALRCSELTVIVVYCIVCDVPSMIGVFLCELHLGQTDFSTSHVHFLLVLIY